MRQVQVLPHDPAWAEQFNVEAQLLKEIFGQEVVAIYHIGSTAIPNLPAKPIIDILVEVRSIERVDDFNAQMIQEGYEPRGEHGLPGRRYFVKGSPDLHTHHVHIYPKGHLSIARHLNFRDYLIAHPSEAERYGKLKQALAAQFPTDVDAYQSGKAALVAELEEQANRWAAGP